MKFLKTVNRLLPTFFPDHWDVFKKQHIQKEFDVSAVAKTLFESSIDNYRMENFKLALPAGYPAVVWFEYKFPKVISLGGQRLDDSPLHGWHVGILANWLDNNHDDIPQTLSLLSLQETRANIAEPNYAQIPIGRNGRFYGSKAAYTFGSYTSQTITGLAALYAQEQIQEELIAYVNMLIMPAYMQINLDNT